MFDLRYHVVSLTAVFLALVIGILVGVGLSGRGFVDDAERQNLEEDIRAAQAERDQARRQVRAAGRVAVAMEEYAKETYPALVAGRLKGRRLALVFVGSVDGTVDRAVRGAVRDAGGDVVRMRALSLPIDVDRIENVVAGAPSLREYVGGDHLDELGRTLGRELVAGGRTPLWDALSETLVEEREGALKQPVDGVVVARPAPAQGGPATDLLGGMYAGLARAGVPAAGVETIGAERSAVPAFSRRGLATIDSVDTAAGRLALVLVLAGAVPGHYGFGDLASDGVLPPVEALVQAP